MKPPLDYGSADRETLVLQNYGTSALGGYAAPKYILYLPQAVRRLTRSWPAEPFSKPQRSVRRYLGLEIDANVARGARHKLAAYELRTADLAVRNFSLHVGTLYRILTLHQFLMQHVHA